jgi:hypothetical protein
MNSILARFHSDDFSRDAAVLPYVFVSLIKGNAFRERKRREEH